MRHVQMCARIMRLASFLLLTGCAGPAPVVIDLDHLPKASAAAPAESLARERAEWKARSGNLPSDPRVPQELLDSLRGAAAASQDLDRQLEESARKQRSEFLSQCDSLERDAAAEPSEAARAWLERHVQVAVEMPAVDCVFYQHFYATSLFFRPSTDGTSYSRVEIVPLAGVVRSTARNPVVTYKDEGWAEEARLPARYGELVSRGGSFEYCVVSRVDGRCVPRVVKRRATVVFEAGGKRVETLHVLDERVRRESPEERGLLDRRVVLYSEAARERLFVLAIGDERDRIDEAMRYAMPREIVYVRGGREVLHLGLNALVPVQRAMRNVPERF